MKERQEIQWRCISPNKGSIWAASWRLGLEFHPVQRCQNKKVLVLLSAVHQTRWVDICWNKLLLQIRQSQCNVSSTRSKSVAMNADWSTLPFLICKFIQEVSETDINLSAQLKISVQVFCPTSLQNPYEKHYFPWKGNDNVYWKTDVAQGTIKAIVELAPKTFKEFETHACIWILLERACIGHMQKTKLCGQLNFCC